MSIVSTILPSINSPFSYMVLAGIVVYVVSASCTKAKTAARFEFIGLCACTTGSVTIMKAIAEACRH